MHTLCQRWAARAICWPRELGADCVMLLALQQAERCSCTTSCILVVAGPLQTMGTPAATASRGVTFPRHAGMALAYRPGSAGRSNELHAAGQGVQIILHAVKDSWLERSTPDQAVQAGKPKTRLYRVAREGSVMWHMRVCEPLAGCKHTGPAGSSTLSSDIV